LSSLWGVSVATVIPFVGDADGIVDGKEVGVVVGAGEIAKALSGLHHSTFALAIKRKPIVQWPRFSSPPHPVEVHFLRYVIGGLVFSVYVQCSWFGIIVFCIVFCSEHLGLQEQKLLSSQASAGQVTFELPVQRMYERIWSDKSPTRHSPTFVGKAGVLIAGVGSCTVGALVIRALLIQLGNAVGVCVGNAEGVVVGNEDGAEVGATVPWLITSRALFAAAKVSGENREHKAEYAACLETPSLFCLAQHITVDLIHASVVQIDVRPGRLCRCALRSMEDTYLSEWGSTVSPAIFHDGALCSGTSVGAAVGTEVNGAIFAGDFVG
jgi:hypothetical protein